MAGWHIDPINIEDLEKVRTSQRREAGNTSNPINIGLCLTSSLLALII
tara:strand:+ start:222 stop:365 length:144 start_codon:yes stop_codon:yes gene_type:complete